jgi:hypothetical protein
MVVDGAPDVTVANTRGVRDGPGLDVPYDRVADVFHVTVMRGQVVLGIEAEIDWSPIAVGRDHTEFVNGTLLATIGFGL